MAWWDWFKRSTTTRVVETEEIVPSVETHEAPSDAPRVGGWTFEGPTTPTGAARDVCDVVRTKTAARADRPTFRVAERGVSPIAVPSLRERAIEYRLFAATAPPAQAANLLQHCLDLEPENSGVWYAYGRALFESERLGDARQALSRALTLAPGDAVTLAALGFVAQESGETEAALGWYEKAAAISPDTGTLRGLAAAQEAAGHHSEAAATRARLDL